MLPKRLSYMNRQKVEEVLQMQSRNRVWNKAYEQILENLLLYQ